MSKLMCCFYPFPLGLGKRERKREAGMIMRLVYLMNVYVLAVILYEDKVTCLALPANFKVLRCWCNGLGCLVLVLYYTRKLAGGWPWLGTTVSETEKTHSFVNDELAGHWWVHRCSEGRTTLQHGAVADMGPGESMLDLQACNQTIPWCKLALKWHMNELNQ